MVYHIKKESDSKIKLFFREYINFRTQTEASPYVKDFLIVFILGIILSYFMNNTFSVYDIFIGGVNTMIASLKSILGAISAKPLLIFFFSAVYYSFFYYYFIMIVVSIIKNLDDKDTWIMSAWLAIITLLVVEFLPRIFNLF